MHLLYSIQYHICCVKKRGSGSGAGGSGSRGDREQSVGGPSRSSSSAGKRPLESAEELEAKRRAKAESASKAEATADLVEIEREAALAAADQRGIGDSKLLDKWTIEVKVLNPEIEATVLATHALVGGVVAELGELICTPFVCNNVRPDLLTRAKFADLALLANPEDSPAEVDLLLRERLSAVIAATRSLHPLGVRAGALARRLMDMFNLIFITMGADAWTALQLQSRESADEQRLPLDIHHQVLRTWKEKLRSALIHVDHRGAFLHKDGTTLRGPVDHLVQAHLARLRAGNRPAQGDARPARRQWRRWRRRWWRRPEAPTQRPQGRQGNRRQAGRQEEQ
jgi:hypothetical protein